MNKTFILLSTITMFSGSSFAYVIPDNMCVVDEYFIDFGLPDSTTLEDNHLNISTDTRWGEIAKGGALKDYDSGFRATVMRGTVDPIAFSTDPITYENLWTNPIAVLPGGINKDTSMRGSTMVTFYNMNTENVYVFSILVKAPQNDVTFRAVMEGGESATISSQSITYNDPDIQGEFKQNTSSVTDISTTLIRDEWTLLQFETSADVGYVSLTSNGKEVDYAGIKVTEISPLPIPEPATASLGLLGLSALFLRRRRH